jgi:hypothetical protein
VTGTIAVVLFLLTELPPPDEPLELQAARVATAAQQASAVATRLRLPPLLSFNSLTVPPCFDPGLA